MKSRTIFLIPALLVAAGCGWGLTPIEKISREPFRYQGRSITVKGRVVGSTLLPEIGRSGVEIEHRGARLLVLTRRSAPRAGEQMRVSGTLEARFDLGDRRAVVLIDEEAGPKANGGAADVR